MELDALLRQGKEKPLVVYIKWERIILLPAEYHIGMVFFHLSVAKWKGKINAGFVLVIFLVHQYLKYTQNFKFPAKTCGGFVAGLVLVLRF